MKTSKHTGFAISSSTISACDVKTSDNETVGKIKDVMIDTLSGEVSYMVLAVDKGFLNLGSKLLALPWQSFEFNTEEHDVLIVKESKEKLEKAPGFDEDNWPSGPQDEFITSIRTYYGVKNQGTVPGDRVDVNTNKSKGENTNVDLSPGIEKETIGDYETGSKFLERDRTGARDISKRHNNNPLTN